MNRPLNHWLTRFIRLLIIEILLYCFLSIAVCIYTFLWVTLCVLSLSHTHSHSHLAQHKYFISRCLHWMPLKLESFSRETMYLHVTVSVRMAVTSLPAPLTIKRSAQNWQDVRLNSRSPIRAGHVKNHPIPITGRSIGASLLFSYATFNYHIPIYNHSEAMIALAISLTECQETLSERRFGKQTCDTYFVWSWRSHEALVLIPKHLGDVTEFFRDISFKNEI